MVTESHSRTSDKLAKAAHEAVDKVAAGADQIEDRIRQTAAEVQHSARERADRAQRMSEDTIANVQDYVHAHPMASLGLAFVAGIVFSAFMRR